MANTTIPSELIQADVALGGSPTTTTQSASDNTTKIATTAYVTAAVNALIDSAPGTMNTLNEIAAALNDDAAFNTTVTNAIATKLPLSGGTMTGVLTGTEFNVGVNYAGRFNAKQAGADAYGIVLEASANDAWLRMGHTGTYAQIDATYNASAGHTPLQLLAGGSARIHIATDGNVGIGTDSPSSFDAGARQLVVGDTSVSSQGITIAADTNSILYFADGTSGSEPYMGSIIYNHSNNDMTFRTNGFNAAMVIDSSQNLLVGTTNTTLYSANSGGGIYAVPNGSTTIARQSTGSTQPLFILNETGVDGTLQEFRKDGSVVGSISNSGTNLIVGGSGTNKSGFYFGDSALFPVKNGSLSASTISFGSPNYRFKDLYLNGKADIDISTNARLTINSDIGEVGDGNVALQAVNSAGSALKPMGFRAEDIRFATGSAERMRITSSGGLEVGDGTNYGYLKVISNNARAGYFDRRNGDGSILEFRKDDTAVGSISATGDDLTIGTGDTGIRFVDASDSIQPINTSTGGRRDAAVDIGVSSYRFKDLYLSGSAIIEDDASSPSILVKAAGQTGSTAPTASIILANGSLSSNASAPAIISYRDTDYSTTALRKSGLKFQVTNANVGLEAMRIDSSGNVGIGSSLPDSILHIEKPSGNNTYLQIKQAGVESWQVGMTASSTALSFLNSGTERIKITATGNVVLPDGSTTVEQTRPLFSGANASSYSTSTNLAYTKSTQDYSITGDHLKARVTARAYTKYVHMKTNLSSDNILFFFKINGYFYNYGVNESVRGGYTYQSGVIAEAVANSYNNNSNYTIGDFYRSSSGNFLCVRLDVHHASYTEGQALVFFGSHSHTVTRELQITDMQHRNDGNNAY